jgi:hypothetical protein
MEGHKTYCTLEPLLRSGRTSNSTFMLASGCLRRRSITSLDLGIRSNFRPFAEASTADLDQARLDSLDGRSSKQRGWPSVLASFPFVSTHLPLWPDPGREGIGGKDGLHQPYCVNQPRQSQRRSLGISKATPGHTRTGIPLRNEIDNGCASFSAAIHSHLP